MEQDEKIFLPIPIVVEGKYDKMKLSQVTTANIITTDGFGVFNKKEKLALIKRLSENGVVLLCDSDGAGGVIRRYIMSAVPKDKVYNLYIPKIKGKERRKREGSKEGTLGVEGMTCEKLYSMLSELAKRLSFDGGSAVCGGITKADFYEDGLTGGSMSQSMRDAFAKNVSLPDGMSATALLGAVNLLMTREEYKEKINRLREATAFGDKGDTQDER